MQWVSPEGTNRTSSCSERTVLRLRAEVDHPQMIYTSKQVIQSDSDLSFDEKSNLKMSTLMFLSYNKNNSLCKLTTRVGI